MYACRARINNNNHILYCTLNKQERLLSVVPFGPRHQATFPLTHASACVCVSGGWTSMGEEQDFPHSIIPRAPPPQQPVWHAGGCAYIL